MNCKKCGNSVKEGDIYCSLCGSRLDGENARSVTASEKLKGTGTNAANVLLLLGAVVAMIFVFFIGVEFQGKKVNLCYFFGDAYDRISDFGYMEMTFFIEETKMQARIYAIVGSIFSAAILICVLGSGIIALYCKIDKQEAASRSWSLFCVISFLVSVAFFTSYNKMAISEENSKMTVVALIGTLLCAILAGVSFLVKAVDTGKAVKKEKNLGKSITGVLVVVISAVLLCMTQWAGMGFRASATGSEELRSSFFLFNLVFTGYYGFNLNAESKGYYEIIKVIPEMNAIGLIGGIFFLLFFVFTFLSLWSSIRNFRSDKTKKGLIYSIGSLLGAVGILVCNLILLSFVKKICSYRGAILKYVRFSGFNLMPILCVVFSASLLATNIVRAVLIKKEK